MNPAEHALKLVLRNQHFSVVQIGAFIGNTENDPFYEQCVHIDPQTAGIILFIEPVAEYFAKLKQTYSAVPQARCENVAISSQDGSATFYRLGVDPETFGLPSWLAQLGSLRSDRIGKLWEQYEDNKQYQEFLKRHQVTEQVECRTLASILSKNKITKIDLLQMDVEGGEMDILESINFSNCPIRFLNFESVLLGTHKTRALEIVHKAGYITVDCGQDTFCCRPEDRRYFRRWMK